MFQKSAVRSGNTAPPYWHAPTQPGQLEDSDPAGQPRAEASLGHNYGFTSYIEEPSSAAGAPHAGTQFQVPHGYRPASYDQDSDFTNIAQVLSHSLAHTRPAVFAAPRARQSMMVRTPTGPRSMRRPGLAGASALVEGQYACQWSVHSGVCGQKFADAKQLNDHVKTYHVRGSGQFECQWIGCDKGSFATANKLVRHVHSHTGYKPFRCPTCLHGFVTKDQLDKHVTTHTGAKDFVCTWTGCGRSFAVKHALDGHVNSVHLKAKKHICSHCSQAFDDSSNLSKHKKQVHNKDTGIRCPARHTLGCTYVDSRKDKMKEHCEREGHGLEMVNDAPAWNMWIQQFKTAPRKADARRQSLLGIGAGSASRASSVTASPFSLPPHSPASTLECIREGCTVPVCMPCNMLCNDLHSANLGEPCDDVECDPCDPCDPCSPCSPCDPGCNDTDCDPATRQPCTIPPCSLAHCQSACSSPTLPSTPLMPLGSYFGYHPLYTDSDMFQESEPPFYLNSG